MPRRVKLKLHYEGSVRVVALSQGVRSSFRELSTRLQQDYGFDVLLRYQDVDGDLIMLDSQNDLLELIGDNDARNDGPSIVVQVSRREDLSSKAKDTAKSECEGNDAEAPVLSDEEAALAYCVCSTAPPRAHSRAPSRHCIAARSTRPR